MKSKKKDFYFLYTVVFAAIAAILFLYFYLNEKSLVWSHDGVPQHLNSLAYYGRYLREDVYKRQGYMGAFLTGALGGLFASHCAIPVMVALLALVAELGKNAWWGILLMVLYALGHSILLIAAGTGYSYVEKIIQNPKAESVGKWLRAILGVVIFLVGLLLVFGEK